MRRRMQDRDRCEGDEEVREKWIRTERKRVKSGREEERGREGDSKAGDGGGVRGMSQGSKHPLKVK